MNYPTQPFLSLCENRGTRAATNVNLFRRLLGRAEIVIPDKVEGSAVFCSADSNGRGHGAAVLEADGLQSLRENSNQPHTRRVPHVRTSVRGPTMNPSNAFPK